MPPQPTAASFLILVAMLVAACSGSPKRPASTATASPIDTPTEAAPTATALAAAPALSQQIGVRAQLPANDPIDLAARYGRTFGRAPASKLATAEANVGDHRTFSVVQLSNGTLEGTIPPVVTPVDTVLLAKSAHAYFYDDVALDPDPAAVQAAADMFEATVWPTVTAAFGFPAIPGVDGDPRIIVLQAGLGGAAGGYFSEDDGYLKAVRPLSNEAVGSPGTELEFAL